MDPVDSRILKTLWTQYFPKETFVVQDSRIGAIQLFQEYFQSDIGVEQTDNLNCCIGNTIYFDVQQLNGTLPFPDFEATLVARPNEVLGCTGLALSLIVNKKNPYLPEYVAIRCRFFNLASILPYGDLKSSSVGQFVSLEGHVVKASACHPLVESAAFLCAKCQQPTMVAFEDGVYLPPDVCATPK